MLDILISQSPAGSHGITLARTVTWSGSCGHEGPTDQLVAETRSGDVVQFSTGAPSSRPVAEGALASGGLALTVSAGH